MFGYVVAGELPPEGRTRYGACYCGLCRALGAYGAHCRLTLTYDLAFLALLQGALYEPEERAGEGRCLLHPLRPRPWWRTDATEYAAAMNVVLAHEKLLDDWRDERNPFSRRAAAALRPAALTAGRAYPRQAEAIRRELAALAALEHDGVHDVDAAGAHFGALMAELFVWKPDRWQPALRTLGDGLGRYIYTLDAVLDLPADRKRGRYNPLIELAPADGQPDRFRPALMALLGDAAAAFESLPLVQDVGILRNVLYSGVWSRFPEKEGPS